MAVYQKSISGDIKLPGEVCHASPALPLSLPPALKISPGGEQLSWCEEVNITCRGSTFTPLPPSYSADRS